MKLEFNVEISERMGVWTRYMVKLGEHADVYRSFVQTGNDDEDTLRRCTWDFASQLHRLLEPNE